MSVILTQIRKYRLDLESFTIFNNQGVGIALFDLISSFIGAYLLEYFFNITKRFNISSSVYYLSVIPIGIIVHLILNTKTFLYEKLIDNSVNIYKILIVVLVIFLTTQINATLVGFVHKLRR